MRLFLIGLTVAALAAVGFLFGYGLQQQQSSTAAEASRVDAPQAAQDAVETAKSQAPAADDDDDEDEEEAAYRDLMAKRALADNCLVCHEESMYTSQRLTSAQWKAELDKMLTWGAVLPEDDRTPVEEYLSKHFGADAPVPTPGRVLLADVSTLEIPGDPSEGVGAGEPVVANGAQLYLVVCASCHGPTATGSELGPALVDRAVLTHAEDYHKVVRDGLRKMPAMNLMLTADQQRDILGWLRTADRDAVAPTTLPEPATIVPAPAPAPTPAQP